MWLTAGSFAVGVTVPSGGTSQPVFIVSIRSEADSRGADERYELKTHK